METLVLATPEKGEVLSRLDTLARETGYAGVAAARDRLEAEGVEKCRDFVNTTLMETYRRTGSGLAFATLYELNARRFFASIVQRLRRTTLPLDPADVLQEVFFNVYRYPHRFLADRDEAFRHWSNRILKNTILKQWRSRSRLERVEQPDEELCERPDRRTQSPLRLAIQRESERTCSFAYVLCLLLYLKAYRRLSPRERRALFLVEVRGASYKEAAADLGIRLENLKMVIFRARRKIFRDLGRTLEERAVPTARWLR